MAATARPAMRRKVPGATTSIGAGRAPPLNESRARCNPANELTAASGVPAPTLQQGIETKSHVAQCRKIRIGQKVERRRPLDMRAAAQGQRAGVIGESERHQECLQDETDGAGASELCGFGHVKNVVARPWHVGRRELKLGRTKTIAGKRCSADRRCCLYCAKMLRHQARFSPVGADIHHPESACCDC